MNLKRSCKYFFIIVLIGCITLLPSNHTKNINGTGNKPGRFIFKAPDRGDVPPEDGTVAIPAAKNKSLVEPLPLPDPDTPIIVNLLY